MGSFTGSARHRADPPRYVVDRQHALGALLDRAQAGVGRDRVEPGFQRASALEARQRAPGAQQRLLEPILPIRNEGEHPVAVRARCAWYSSISRAKASWSPLRAASMRSPLHGSSLGCHSATVPRLGARDDAAPTRRAFPRFEQHSRAKPAGTFRRPVDLVDLDVGQPQRAARPALDDPAAEARARLGRDTSRHPCGSSQVATAGAERRRRTRALDPGCEARGGRRASAARSCRLLRGGLERLLRLARASAALRPRTESTAATAIAARYPSPKSDGVAYRPHR